MLEKIAAAFDVCDVPFLFKVNDKPLNQTKQEIRDFGRAIDTKCYFMIYPKKLITDLHVMLDFEQIVADKVFRGVRGNSFYLNSSSVSMGQLFYGKGQLIESKLGLVGSDVSVKESVEFIFYPGVEIALPAYHHRVNFECIDLNELRSYKSPELLKVIKK